MQRSVHRIVPIAAILLVTLATLTGSCSTAEQVGPVGKQELARAEMVRLERDISKVDKSIEVTKELVNTSTGESYEPDLYFRLAELQIEKSRLVYFRAVENADGDTGVNATEARLLKDEAISIYRRIPAEFPDYPDNDKITFFIAHEYRELGAFPEMIATYEDLITKYPHSSFRYEAWLNLGDYHFDKGEVDDAILNYRAILRGPETYAHNMARYKLGWCYLNKDKPALAVDLWEQAVRTPAMPEEGAEAVDPLQDKTARLDVRQDALRDLAYYYAESRDPKTAIAFFKDITVSRQEYKSSLERLAKRFQVKTMYEESAKTYRELVRVSADVDRNLEWAEAIYQAAIAARDLAHADEDVVMLTEVSARYKYWWRANDTDKAVLKDFELLTRDLSTRLHTLAKEKRDPELFARAATAYAAYLSVFDDSSAHMAMEWNYAETLFAAKRYVSAGDRYEQVLKLVSDGPATASLEGDKKQAMYSAILSYFEALKSDVPRTRFDTMRAREGIKDLGGRFVASYPDDANTPNVKFNIARAYFEQGQFKKSIDLFNAFVHEYPQHKDAVTAASLALDAYDRTEDFATLAKTARAFAADLHLGDADARKRFEQIAVQAEERLVRRVVIDKPTAPPIASLSPEAQAKLLYLRFVTARDAGDLEQMSAKGRQLIEEFPTSTYAKEVLPSLGEQALRVSQLEQAATYFEEYARRFPNGQGADDVLAGAAQIRDQLGDSSAAMADYERLARGDDAKKPLWLAKLAETAHRAKDWRRAEETALQLTNDRAYGLVANTVAGEAAFRTGRLEIAGERLSAAVNAKLPGPGVGEDGPAWLGRANYLLGEIVRADFERVQFRSGEEGAALQQKFQLLDELQATYLEAIKAGDPEWAMGGLYRIAIATRQTAELLENAPTPQGLSADEEKQYKKALADRAAPLRKQASDALDQCRAQAKKLEAFNRFTKACVAGGELQEDGDDPRPRPVSVAIPGRGVMEAKLIENPKDMTTLVQLIRAAIQVNDHPLAGLLAARALEIDDKSSVLHNLQGVAYAGNNDMQAAAASFKRALREDPRNSAAAANLATIYAMYGDDARAKELLAKAGSVDASSPDVLPQAARR